MNQVRGDLLGLDSFLASFINSCPFDLTGRGNDNVGSAADYIDTAVGGG
jgi:hypothetical protein